MRTTTLATCTLNLQAMDFSGNYEKILESIKQAKEKGACYRSGPELEITGYSCGDHFYESDTFLHSWQVLAQLLKHEICQNIIIDVGMPVMHKNVAYNCRVIFLNKNILLIRPKKRMCDSGIYHETRWFSGWSRQQFVEEFYLPNIIKDICHQNVTLIGDGVISTPDACIGFEICEELWNPVSSNINHFYDGVDIIVNSSAGFHEIGKTSTVVEMIKTTTSKCGGVYLFSNLRGCDGDRLYFHGTSHISCNGKILSLGKQFSLQDVEVVTATVDLDDVRAYRNHISRSFPTAMKPHPAVRIEFTIVNDDAILSANDVRPKVYDDGEEISLGSACWLWDYLRKSQLNGFFLNLEGDIDSSSSAVIVYTLCNLVFQSINEGDSTVLTDLRKIINDPEYIPMDPKDICNILLTTCHIKTESVASKTLEASKNLAAEINSNHINAHISDIIDAFIAVMFLIINLKIETKNNSSVEKSAIKILKEHIKLTLAYMISRLLLLSKGKCGSLLVLGSGNADFIMAGNFVKYGKCNGDISLTAAISRQNLEFLLKYSMTRFKLDSLESILNLNKKESSNEIIELQDIELLSKLRKKGCGPFSAFSQMVEICEISLDVSKISSKVKKFFASYSHHHHKIYTLPPCFHLGSYANANQHNDQRQVLYSSNWTWQFHAIEKEANYLLKNQNQHVSGKNTII